MKHSSLSLLSRGCCKQVLFEIDVRVLRNVEVNFVNRAASEVEAWLVQARDCVTAVVADAETLTAEGEAHLRADRAARDFLVIDVKLRRAVRLMVLAHLLLDELNANDVTTRRGRITGEPVLGW